MFNNTNNTTTTQEVSFDDAMSAPDVRGVESFMERFMKLHKGVPMEERVALMREKINAAQALELAMKRAQEPILRDQLLMAQTAYDRALLNDGVLEFEWKAYINNVRTTKAKLKTEKANLAALHQEIEELVTLADLII